MSVIQELNSLTNISNILEEYPDKTVFVFSEGEYYLTGCLVINRPFVQFIGPKGQVSKVVIKQLNPNYNSICVEQDGFYMSGITVDSFNNPNSALVINSNQVVIKNCCFFGFNDSIAYPTVSFIGKKDGESSDTEDYENNIFSKKNQFHHNLVSSLNPLSVRLQREGLWKRNVLRGGGIEVKGIRDCKFIENTILSSKKNGLLLELGDSITFYGNTICDTEQTGILVNSSIGMTIKENIIKSSYGGIEVIRGDDIEISKNEISTRLSSSLGLGLGLTLTRCENVRLVDNIFCHFRIGVSIDRLLNSLVNNNLFFNLDREEPEAIFFIDRHLLEDEEVSKSNLFNNNLLKGQFNEEIINKEDLDNSNIFINNKQETYYNYKDEQLLQKII